jgi:ribosomal protein S11
MQITLILAVLLPFCLSGIIRSQHKSAPDLPPQNNTLFEHVGDIPVPAGYTRIETGPGSFGNWLRKSRLKSDKVVYLYNGTKKYNQDAQFAVLATPVGKKDLQQCADAVMRLRAEYLLDAGRRNEICFIDNAGKKYLYTAESGASGFERFLEKVYSYCGTSSLSRQLKAVVDFKKIKPGDILIKGGFPGHAVIVMDVAVNRSGQKIYMIAQSYMPAQSIHVLKNPLDNSASPWYPVDGRSDIMTPEWTFKTNQLMEW